MVYSDHHFTNIGKCYRNREDAIKRLRQLRAENDLHVINYSETYLFILYYYQGRRIEVDFETKALR